jgi:leucyl-tRNA synthetase
MRSWNRLWYETFLTILAPLAPHIADEIWHELGHKKSIHVEAWPKYSTKRLHSATITIGVQINSRVRGEISIAPNAQEKDAVIAANKNETVAKWLEDKEVKK